MKSKALSIVVLLLAVVLLGLLFVNHRQEQRQTAYMQQLQKEAMPYEQEINDIRLELAQKQRAINIEEDTSGILFGFVPASADDFTEIDKLAAEHSITPVILLDCSQEKEQLAQILEKAVAKDYEVALAGLQIDESILQTADEMKDLLAQIDDTKSLAFLLRNNANTEETRNLLNEHMPLKGSILKDWYPKFGMREMADNDILFDATRRQQVRDIFVNRGYSIESYNKSSNHDAYEKQPIYNFEMHVALFHEDCSTLQKKYENVVDRLVQDEKLPFRYHFTPEDFYVFVVAHAYKHYSHGGTGIRTLADFYVMNRKLGKTLDWEYVESELRSLGILDYERDSRKLSQKLFGNTKTVLRPELTEEENQMFAYYLGATTYGNLFNQTLHRMQEFQPDGEPLTTKTKGKYIISRMFPNMEWCKCYAPVVYKFPVLLPFYWVWRLIYKGITKRKKVTQEIKALKAVSRR